MADSSYPEERLWNHRSVIVFCNLCIRRAVWRLFVLRASSSFMLAQTNFGVYLHFPYRLEIFLREVRRRYGFARELTVGFDKCYVPPSKCSVVFDVYASFFLGSLLLWDTVAHGVFVFWTVKALIGGFFGIFIVGWCILHRSRLQGERGSISVVLLVLWLLLSMFSVFPSVFVFGFFISFVLLRFSFAVVSVQTYL